MNIHDIKHRDQIKFYLHTLDQPKICEVGVANGDNFRHLLTPNTSFAVAVDPWRVGYNEVHHPQEKMDEIYNRVVQTYVNDNRVKALRTDSVSASKMFKDEYFDFVYIDGGHTYEDVIEDLESWFPKVKVGGFISGHDYISVKRGLEVGHPPELINEFGVIEAVETFMNKYSLKNLHVTDEDYASYFIRRVR
jgi:hypothetical protein